MHIAIVIVGYKNAEDIRLCLTALARSSYPDFQVLICENGGDAAYEALAATVPSTLEPGQPVRVVQAPGNVGYAGGVNIGLKATAVADAWWILNPDTEPHQEALANLVTRLQRGNCEAVGGVLYREDGQVQSDGGKWISYLARAVSLNMGRHLDSPPDSARVEAEMNYISGASLLVNRKFIEQAGMMREDYFLYCEEVEWCLRARSRGLTLGYAPAARIMHRQGTTTGWGRTSRRRPRMPVFLDQRNKILLTRDLYPRLLPITAVASLLLTIVRFLRDGAIAQAAYSIEGWFAGLRNQRGPYPAPESTDAGNENDQTYV